MLTQELASPGSRNGLAPIHIYQDPEHDSNMLDQNGDQATNLFDQLSKSDSDFFQANDSDMSGQLSQLQSRQIPLMTQDSEEVLSSQSSPAQEQEEMHKQQEQGQEHRADPTRFNSPEEADHGSGEKIPLNAEIPLNESSDHGVEFQEERGQSADEVLNNSRLPADEKYDVTLSEGYKFQLFKKLRKMDRPSSTTTADDSRQYYGVPIHSMLQKLEDQKRTEEQVRSTQAPVSVPLYKSLDQMLSEKWRPKKWLDLMGSEKTNRAMMKWLVSWNEFVFESKRSLIPVDDSLKNGCDELGRPFKKILLVHGPPGIGKTSVAQIIAKQAGYSVLEINASDERSAQAVSGTVQTAADNHRINSTSSTNKPVCIIADEIEGAAENGFIKGLINLIQADQRAVQDFGKSRGSKSKRGSKLLLRPIIAICNDVYASSLRQLRPFAEVLHYPRADNRSVVSRLREICQQEKIPLDSKKLADIATTAGGDFRSCLNMIQFGIQGQDSLFDKDVGKSWTKVTNLMFRKLDRSVEDDWKATSKDIVGSGEYDKIVAGCFALYPHMHYTDDMVCKPGYIGDWMHFYEELNRGIYSGQNGQLADYLVHPVQAFHNFFSSTVNVKDRHPGSELYELFEKKRESQEMIKDFISECSSTLRQSFDERAMLLELIPLCMSIISPTVEISGSALRTTEKSKIDYASGAMFDTGLRFFKEKLSNGTTVLRLDPPIERLACYDQSLQDTQAVGKYTIRKVILETLIQAKNYRERGESDFTRVQVDKRAFHATALARSDESEIGSKKKRKVKPAGKRDFFGNLIVSPVKEKQQELTPSVSEDSEDRLWVQYFEGFSNAVKKDLSWSNFWTK